MNINQKILQLEKELQELKEQVANNHLGRRIQTLMEAIEKEENKTPIDWMPETGAVYHYVVGRDGDIKFLINNTEWDDTVIEHYKVFKTEAETAVYAEKLKITRELDKFAKEFVYGEGNWAIAYNYTESRIYYTFTTFMRSNLVYFESKEKAQVAVQTVGEDRIKKYYLGIKG